MPQLDLATYPSQLFWLSVFFTSLYIFVKIYITPTINSLVELRQMKISEDINQALETKNKAADLQQQYDEARQKSLYKISEMLDGELSNLNNITKQKNDIVTTNINQQLQQAEEMIAKYRADYIRELDQVVLSHSAFLIKKIANLDVSSADLIKYKKA